MTKTTFVCIKLSSETIFAELISNTETNIRVLHPMKVKNIVMENNQDGILLSNWIPYVDAVEFDISMFKIDYIGQLKNSFLKFYGASRIKEEINNINRRGFERVEDGENPKLVTSETVHEMQELIDLYCLKYGLDAEEYKENYSLNDVADDAKKVLH